MRSSRFDSTSAICWSVASTFMKISSVTPPLSFSVPWSTHFDNMRMPPNSDNDTATVAMPAMVMSTLRRSETIVSRAK